MRSWLLATAAGVLALACTAGVRGKRDGGGNVDGTASQPETKDVAGAVDLGCINLQCRQVKCDGEPTSISGTAFAPNGTLPLYNVRVYVPNTPLAPFKPGVTCDQCSAVVSGNPIASAVSNEEGKFKLTNVPEGKDVPLVFQVGKWRRRVVIPNVVACQDNPIADANLTRLPRNRSEGDLPRIAVTTGSCDQLGCLLPKVGIDVAELGVAGENTAVHFYQGGGGAFGPPNMLYSIELWNSELALKNYDVTLLSCECNEALASKPKTSFEAMTNYLAAGGRIFGTDFQYVWLRNASDPLLAGALAQGSGSGANPITVDTTFPKGKAMADWMKFLDPSVRYGEINAEQVFGNWGAATPGAARVWATMGGGRGANGGVGNPAIVTVSTPVGVPADKRCGRAAHIDAHITLPDSDANPANFPGGCGDKLTRGEEALAFLFFDLTACVQPDTEPIYPPIIVP